VSSATFMSILVPIHVDFRQTATARRSTNRLVPLDRDGRPWGCWRASKFMLILVFVYFLAEATVTLASAAPVKELRRVLVFYEWSVAGPGIAAVDKEIRGALDESPFQIELYTENLETNLFPEESSQQEFLQWYIHKYRDRKLDLIIAEGSPSIEFMAKSHGRFFPGVPIVFCCSPQVGAAGPQLDTDFTGAWMDIAPATTLDVALRLQPQTQHIVVVGGVSQLDRQVEELTRESLRIYEDRFEFTYLTDLALPNLLERLRHLPSNTIVFYTSLSRDAAGTPFIDAKQVLPIVASMANAPVFSMADVYVGQGTVGGYVSSYAMQGRAVGQIAMRILQGKKPQDIPILKNTNVFMFDWRALRRWGIRESNLPPGSVVLNRQPTAWESYRWYIIGAISLIVAEMLLIFGLVWQRARRRRVEAELATLGGRLIEAHEEERSRIAREIHDDYQQRLAFLAIDLEELAENIGRSPTEVSQKLHELWNRVGELGADLHDLSHSLHSSTLETLGLVAGVRAFCEEFAGQQELHVDFEYENVPRAIPGEIALCLFRIAQEGLRNVKRHSGADRAEVRLEGLAQELHLSVSDRGRGFDSNGGSPSGGIGLRSMEERLRLLGGNLQIYSRPMEGTRIDAWLSCKNATRRASQIRG
jgi:signal transduction histidine kinase